MNKMVSTKDQETQLIHLCSLKNILEPFQINPKFSRWRKKIMMTLYLILIRHKKRSLFKQFNSNRIFEGKRNCDI